MPMINNDFMATIRAKCQRKYPAYARAVSGGNCQHCSKRLSINNGDKTLNNSRTTSSEELTLSHDRKTVPVYSHWDTHAVNNHKVGEI